MRTVSYQKQSISENAIVVVGVVPAEDLNNSHVLGGITRKASAVGTVGLSGATHGRRGTRSG